MLDYVGRRSYLDVPDLVLRLWRTAAGSAPSSTRVLVDIGRHDDYEKAILEYDR